MKKITDPDVIRAGERDLIESIKDDLDWNVIKDVFLHKIKSSSFDIKSGALSFDVSGGEIVVHNGNIAFRLDLELKTEMPILFDKDGNYITDEQSKSITDSEESNEYEVEEAEEISRVDAGAVDELKSDAAENGLLDVEILDDISSLEDEDILGDVDEQDAGGLVDPLSDINQFNQFNELNENDDIENILKESREFWGKEE